MRISATYIAVTVFVSPVYALDEAKPRILTDNTKAFFKDVVIPSHNRRNSRYLANNGNGVSSSVDLTDYSFRYARCQTLTMFNDEAAAVDDDNNYGVRQSVTTAEDFVVFRFCPTDTCEDGSTSSNPYGCTSGYGEYLLPLADYLDERFNYLENKRLQHCSGCVKSGCPDYSNGANDGYENVDDYVKYNQGENSYYYNNDDGGKTYYYKNNNGNADAYNGQYNNYYNHRMLADDDAYGDDADACADACPNYNQTCGSEFYYDVDFSPADYFDCVAFDGYNDQGQQVEYYLGAHCAARSGAYSNDVDIAIGVFSDQYCTQYIGSQVDIASFTSLPFQDDLLKLYYKDHCESCATSDLEYYDTDDNETESVSRSCAYLYGISAKCHKYMGYNFTDSTSDYEQRIDEKNCAFIENVAAGKYSESGEIIISNKAYNNQKRKHSEHQEEKSAISYDQAIWLAAFAVLNVGLLVYSCIVISTIRSRKPWRKTGGGAAALAGKVSRANMGVGTPSTYNYSGGAMA